jgi:hypothetical protein
LAPRARCKRERHTWYGTAAEKCRWKLRDDVGREVVGEVGVAGVEYKKAGGNGKCLLGPSDLEGVDADRKCTMSTIRSPLSL